MNPRPPRASGPTVRDDSDPEPEGFDLDDGALDLELPDGDLEDTLAADATDLDVGSVVDNVTEDAQPDDEGSAIRYDEALAPLPDEQPGDDTDGPGALDLGAGLTAGPDWPDTPEDEATDGDEDLTSTPLPELDADEEGWTELSLPELPGSTRDEAPPPWSESPWGWEPTSHEPRACASIAVGIGVVAAAGPGVIWLVTPRSEPLRSIADTRVTSLALVGPAPILAIAITAGGPVLSVSREGAVTRCEGWRAAAGLADPGATLALVTLTSGLTSAVIGRASNGALLRSADSGRGWTRLDLGGPVVSLGTGVDAPLALVRTAAGTVIARGSHDGATWVRRPLPPSAVPLTDGDDPLVAGVDSCVLLANADRGVALSTDGGTTFRRLPGLAGATALAVGRLGGRPAAWLALYSDADEATDLVLIDLDREQPLRVARVSAPDPEVGGARVVALAWEDDAGRLWAAGELGVGAFSPPRQ